MTTTFKVDGKASTREKAKAAFVARDANHDAAEWFDQACEQSQTGYVCREAVEAHGVTVRHSNEEQA